MTSTQAVKIKPRPVAEAERERQMMRRRFALAHAIAEALATPRAVAAHNAAEHNPEDHLDRAGLIFEIENALRGSKSAPSLPTYVLQTLADALGVADAAEALDLLAIDLDSTRGARA